MKKQTAGREQLGAFASKFAEINDDILFGEVWSRENQLPSKQRSIITICALVSKGIFDESLKSHLQNAKNNGVSQSELAEIITHLAFYAGWPNAWATFRLAKEVYGDDDNEVHGGIFGQGELNEQYAQYFVGNSYLNPLTSRVEGLPSVSNVTFEPSCRNNWHIHQASKGGGQILICVEGSGWYQAEGEAARSLNEGDVVVIPPNVKHWHGAKKDSWFSHLAIEVLGEDTSTVWLEPVHNYDKL